MTYLLTIFDLGIRFLVPAIVWTMLVIGLFQLVRESIPKPRVTSRQVAPQGSSR